MVHTQNSREANPNPHVKHITSLPRRDAKSPAQEDARQLLRALAAQVRPVMKEHGFSVNSLEEVGTGNIFVLGIYRYNQHV